MANKKNVVDEKTRTRIVTFRCPDDDRLNIVDFKTFRPADWSEGIRNGKSDKVNPTIIFRLLSNR